MEINSNKLVMKFTAEQIQENYNDFLSNISKYISSPRKEQLLDFYKEKEEILVLAPASSREAYHSAFTGGYVDHVNRVVKASLDLYELWNSYREIDTFTKEELVFSAINHDLGKLGVGNKPSYIPNDSEWHIKNQGQIYKTNTELPFFTVPDRSLFTLQQAGIYYSENEYLGIKLHDGLYDDVNKPYLISYNVESRLRTSLPLILHQADFLASRVEWEDQWLHKLGKKQEPKVNNYKSNNEYSKGPSQQAYKQLAIKNQGLMDAFKNI
jgi:hypothetical protein